MALLFLSCTFLSFASAHSSVLGKWLSKLTKIPTSEERRWLNEKQQLKLEQQQYNMMDHFAKYSKIQRKINALDEKLKDSKETRNSITYRALINYGPQIVCTLILLLLTLYYRRTPLFKLPDYLDLTPFNFIISYPNERNFVSFHFWVMSCNIVARLLKT